MDVVPTEFGFDLLLIFLASQGFPGLDLVASGVCKVINLIFFERIILSKIIFPFP